MLLFFKIIIHPISGDDWIYGSSYPLNKLFFLEYGWHPGRHISEILYIIPSQIFGKILGISIGNNLLSVRIINSIMGIIMSICFYWVSSQYIINDLTVNQKTNNFTKLFIIILLSFYMQRFTSHMVYSSIVVGGFVLALFAWLPFLYYYYKCCLPLKMMNNKFQTYGIMIVIFYLGTQIIDTAYFITVSLSIMLVFYILGQKFFPDLFEKTKISKKDQNFILILLGTHIVYVFFAFFRNTILSPNQASSRAPHITFDIIEIIHRIKQGPWLQDLSMVIGGLIILYYIYKIIKNKILKKEDFLYLSMCIVSLLWIVILSIINTPIDHPLWLLWLCEINLIFKSYKNNNRIIQLLLPIILLGIFINVFERERKNLNKSGQYYQRDQILVDYYIDAQQNNKKFIIIPVDLANKINLNITEHQKWPLKDISLWMQYHGYSDRYIPITFISNK
ncbi:MAG: hypothetical protein KFW21_01350 [Spirochaetota bacterium]|nr:hypothetical protein [Spirochaetota bacterium]